MDMVAWAHVVWGIGFYKNHPHLGSSAFDRVNRQTGSPGKRSHQGPVKVLHSGRPVKMIANGRTGTTSGIGFRVLCPFVPMSGAEGDKQPGGTSGIRTLHMRSKKKERNQPKQK